MDLKGALGSVRNRKNYKKSSKTAKSKKIGPKPKTTCKTFKTDKFSHPSYQSDTVVASGALRGLMAIQNQLWHIIAAQIEEKPEPKWVKQKTTSDTKSENPLVFFTRLKAICFKTEKS